MRGLDECYKVLQMYRYHEEMHYTDLNLPLRYEVFVHISPSHLDMNQLGTQVIDTSHFLNTRVVQLSRTKVLNEYQSTLHDSTCILMKFKNLLDAGHSCQFSSSAKLLIALAAELLVFELGSDQRRCFRPGPIMNSLSLSSAYILPNKCVPGMTTILPACDGSLLGFSYGVDQSKWPCMELNNQITMNQQSDWVSEMLDLVKFMEKKTFAYQRNNPIREAMSWVDVSNKIF